MWHAVHVSQFARWRLSPRETSTRLIPTPASAVVAVLLFVPAMLSMRDKEKAKGKLWLSSYGGSHVFLSLVKVLSGLLLMCRVSEFKFLSGMQVRFFRIRVGRYPAFCVNRYE